MYSMGIRKSALKSQTRTWESFTGEEKRVWVLLSGERVGSKLAKIKLKGEDQGKKTKQQQQQKKGFNVTFQ